MARVKVNVPQPAKRAGVPEAYRWELSPQHAIESVVRSAGFFRLPEPVVPGTLVPSRPPVLVVQ
jgi:hypothetical protein